LTKPRHQQEKSDREISGKEMMSYYMT
jgi:hypothetical protein